MSTFGEDTGIRFEDLTKDLQEMFKPKFTYDNLADLRNRFEKIKALNNDIRVTIGPNKPSDPRGLKELYVDPALPQPYMYTSDNQWRPIQMVPTLEMEGVPKVKVHIIQKAHQTIEVVVDGVAHRDDFEITIGRHYHINWWSNESQWVSGSPNMPQDSIFLGDSVFYLSDAVPAAQVFDFTRLRNNNNNPIRKTVTFAMPIVMCAFTWHNRSDERGDLRRGGTRIQDLTTGRWWYDSRYGSGPGGQTGQPREFFKGLPEYFDWALDEKPCTFIRVTPGKPYDIEVHISGYKARDYGFILFCNPEVQRHAPQLNDTY